MGDRHEVVGVLLECIREAAAPRVTCTTTARGRPSQSHNLSWVTKVLTLEDSPWIKRSLRLEQLESPSPRRGLSSDVEKLRAHLALSLDHGAGAEAPEELRVLRRVSRGHVYDLRGYAREAHWGPFTDAGEHVNWSHECWHDRDRGAPSSHSHALLDFLHQNRVKCDLAHDVHKRRPGRERNVAATSSQ